MIAAGTGGEWPSHAATERARDLLQGVVTDAPAGIRPEWLLLHGVPADEIAGRAYGVVDLLFVAPRRRSHDLPELRIGHRDPDRMD